MKSLLVFTLILLGAFAMNAQNTGIDPGDASFIQKYQNFDFKGRFAVMIDHQDQNNYYLLDFSQFSSRFEKVYFMNLSFSNYRIINIDPDIAKSRVCFMSNVKYSETEVVAIFDDLKKNTSAIANQWTVEEKAKWLKENDKYK